MLRKGQRGNDGRCDAGEPHQSWASRQFRFPDERIREGRVNAYRFKRPARHLGPHQEPDRAGSSSKISTTLSTENTKPIAPIQHGTRFGSNRWPEDPFSPSSRRSALTMKS